MTNNARFFVDDLDGEGTVAYTHLAGDTQSIVTLGNEELAATAVEHLNQFFGADYRVKPFEYYDKDGYRECQKAGRHQSDDNLRMVLEDFLLWSTGGEDRNIETSYEMLCEAAHSYVTHLDEMWPDHRVTVDFTDAEA